MRVIQMLLQGPRDVVDIVVGSHGALRKLFHEGYLKTGRTSMLVLDEIDTLLDDTFKVNSALLYWVIL